ncbi:MAG: hypothetical protein FWG52_03345 [Proteobacteria bacterium]|nr:hypothetical protein [Pseudomonadota bacterium]
MARVVAVTLALFPLLVYAADQPVGEKKPFSKDELALCQTEACRVVKVHSAGKGENNKPLRVVELYLGDTRDGEVCERVDNQTGPDGQELYWGAGRDGHKQYWLLGGSEKKLLLADLCISESVLSMSTKMRFDVDVDDNKIELAVDGSRNYQRSIGVQLSPLSVLYESSGGQTHDDGWQDTDWRNLYSTVTPLKDDCEEYDGEGKLGTVRAVEMALIPRFSGKTDLPKDATDAVLGSCSLEMNAGKGFTIKGDQDDDNQWMRSLIVGDELWVSVRANGLRAQGNDWTDGDHLELWLADDGILRKKCTRLKPGKQGLQQWGIGLVDGKVYPGYGVKPQKKERQPVTLISRTELKDPTTHDPLVNFRIALPKDIQNLTLALVRGDGSKQTNVIATSMLEYDRKGWDWEIEKAMLLGRFLDLKTEGRNVECAIVDGRLDLIRSSIRPHLPLSY